jgi:hypothetical protein
MRFFIIVGALAFALVGCAPVSSTTQLSPSARAAQSATHPIALFTSSVPTCAFDEIATVRAGPPLVGPQPTNDQLLEQLRTQARKVGGDAVIHVRNQDEQVENLTGNATHFSRSYTGTVIAFRDTTCVK